MGKWLERLHEKIPAPPSGGTAKTDETPLLAVMSVGAEGGAPVFTQAPTDPERRRLDVLARLLRWHWPPELANATAARIAQRDADDDRRVCPECAHYRPGRCANHRAAGLHSPDVGRDLAALPERCPSYSERGET